MLSFSVLGTLGPHANGRVRHVFFTLAAVKCCWAYLLDEAVFLLIGFHFCKSNKSLEESQLFFVAVGYAAGLW